MKFKNRILKCDFCKNIISTTIIIIYRRKKIRQLQRLPWWYWFWNLLLMQTLLFLYLLFKVLKEFSERYSTSFLCSFHDGDKFNAEDKKCWVFAASSYSSYDNCSRWNSSLYSEIINSSIRDLFPSPISVFNDSTWYIHNFSPTGFLTSNFSFSLQVFLSLLLIAY